MDPQAVQAYNQLQEAQRRSNMATIIREGLEYRDMLGVIKPTVHIDEFESTMGTDEDIIVLSFLVRNNKAAEDLVNWFERGYDFVIDAARSPGEIKPNRFLVFVELRRNERFPELLHRLLEEMYGLTDVEPKQYKVRVDRKYYNYDPKLIRETVALSPSAYQERQEAELNNLRETAELPHKPVHRVSRDIRALQDLAHIQRS